jgi:hypothetical protein
VPGDMDVTYGAEANAEAGLSSRDWRFSSAYQLVNDVLGLLDLRLLASGDSIMVSRLANEPGEGGSSPAF